MNLQDNRVADTDEVAALEPLTRLRILHLRDPDGGRANPVCAHPSYMSTVAATFPDLQLCDGEHQVLRRAAQDVLAEAAAAAAAVDAGTLPAAYSRPWFPPAGRRTRGTAADVSLMDDPTCVAVQDRVRGECRAGRRDTHAHTTRHVRHAPVSPGDPCFPAPRCSQM